MSSPYPVLDDKPIDQWRVTELREELKRRELSTKGLKEELVKRLSNALVSEPDTIEDVDNGSDDLPKSDIKFEEDEKRYEIIDDVVASQPEAVSEEGKSGSLVSRTAEAGMESGTNTIQMESDNPPKSDIQLEEDEKRSEIIDDVVASEPEAVSEEGKSGSVVSKAAEAGMESGTNSIQVGDSDSMNEDGGKIGSVVDGKDAKENGVGYVSNEDKHPAETFIHELPVVKEDIAVVVSISHPELDHDKTELDKPQSLHADDGDSRSVHHTSSTVSSDLDNKAPEISLAVEVQVKSGFTSAESESINEKNAGKDNIIADTTLQTDVMPEMMELSSSTAVLGCTESDHADEEKNGDTANIVDDIKKEESVDTGSLEKLNLDHSSGDDSMEEDVPESKQNSGSDLLGPKVVTMEPSFGREDINIADAVDMSLETEVVEMEYEKSSTAVPSKRKLDDQSTVENNDATKRQRPMQPDAVKLPREQNVNTVAFTKRKDYMHPTVKGGFSKLESADSEAPKERVVPPSAKPPTTSLRIDRFLRPFTLKAVQDLLGRTGTVFSFWMDHIKTHCFVTYSSVEEAIETRNAVYNLQWPTNGGRLLIADFVDPQEVKARVEGPPLQSPMTPTTPAGMRPSFPSAQPARPPQPSLRQQVQRQQLPPPPPLLANPIAAREKVLQINKQLPPVKEQHLVPPPQVSEKVDPPALTLDDLFRKTMAGPRIYYLPLSDEQVAAKLKAQGNNIKH